MLVSAAPSPRPQPASERILPVAAGGAVAPLLRAPKRTGEVVAHTRDMIAVHVEGADPGLVCVTARSAVRLPCAMITNGPLPRAEVGTRVSVGNNRLRMPGAVIVVARWWAAHPALVADPDRCARHAAQCPPPDLDPQVLTAAAALAEALHSPAHRFASAVRALLGLGPGLTPLGDDVLAGALVALCAVRSDLAGRLATAIADAAPLGSTTTVSAGLLAYAARGRCVPELAVFLRALAEGIDPDPARRGLLAVGHTSGSGLYAGVLGALAGPDPLVTAERRRM